MRYANLGWQRLMNWGELLSNGANYFQENVWPKATWFFLDGPHSLQSDQHYYGSSGPWPWSDPMTSTPWFSDPLDFGPWSRNLLTLTLWTVIDLVSDHPWPWLPGQSSLDPDSLVNDPMTLNPWPVTAMTPPPWAMICLTLACNRHDLASLG